MRARALLPVLALCAGIGAAAPAPDPSGFADPQPVTIEGYAGDAMEPFVTRDGKLLLFNNRNEAPQNTDLHWAQRIDALHYRYRGRIAGANTAALEGVPSLDDAGELVFISPRAYDATLMTVYRAHFAGGVARGVEAVRGLASARRGLVTFDAEVSADGRWLYGAEGDFTDGKGPRAADLFVARRTADGFARTADSNAMMAAVNTPDLEYAPSVSADGRELFFTRTHVWLGIWPTTTIERAVRRSRAEAFAPSTTVRAAQGFVEGPSLSGDGRTLLFHCKLDGVFGIWRLTRR